MNLKFENVQIFSPLKIDSISASSQITTTSGKNLSDLRKYLIQKKESFIDYPSFTGVQIQHPKFHGVAIFSRKRGKIYFFGQRHIQTVRDFREMLRVFFSISLCL